MSPVLGKPVYPNAATLSDWFNCSTEVFVETELSIIREEPSIYQRKDSEFLVKRRWSLLDVVFRFISALSRRRWARKRDCQLVIENKRRKALYSWRIISLSFQFLYKMRKCCEETKKDLIVSSFRSSRARMRDWHLMMLSQENERRKALDLWRTISLSFEFLYKMRKYSKERKKDQIVSPFRRPIIKKWQKGKYLGRGSFSVVYEAFTDDGFFFAVKEFLLHGQDSQSRQNISQAEQEISLLSQFQHENIIRYLGSDKDDSKFYIFLELATQGSLARLYQNYELWDSQVSTYTRQILSGLNYLHHRNVIHRDIKCANILVDVSGSVKLADFGLAKAIKLNEIISCKGTPFWMAPEVVNLKNHGYGTAADIWSLGCTVLEMLTRQIPYSNLEVVQAIFKIGKGQGPRIPCDLSSNAQDFIRKCLQVNQDYRPTAAQLLEHPFVKNQ